MRLKGNSAPIYMVGSIILVILVIVAYFAFFQSGLDSGLDAFTGIIDSHSSNPDAIG